MRSICHLLVSSLVIGAFVAQARPARAQSTVQGFALDTFNPSERGSEWFAEDSLDIRGNLRPAVGVIGDYGMHPLVLYNPDGSVRANPVEDQLIVHPGASIVLWERLRLAFDLPVAVYQDGHTGTVGNTTFDAVSSAAVGDLRLSADVRLVGEPSDAFVLAAGAQVFLPSGEQSGYLGDGSTRVMPRVAVAGDIGPFVYAAHVAFVYRSLTSTITSNNALGSEFAFGAAAGLRVADRKLVIGPEIYGSTVVTSGDSAFATSTTPVELIGGLHYLVGSAFRIGAGAGPGLNRAYGEPELRALLSLEWAPAYEKPAPPDRDGDGVIDAEDACPDTPGVRTDDPTTNGCPPPPPPPPADRDKDGIPDEADACPDVPGVKTDDPKTNGCPPDRDHDGIIDAEDACPDTPGVKTDDPKTNGCPPDLDRDKDGIPNDVDACPDTPGPANSDPKKNGCPAAAVVGKQIVITDQVKFATGSAKILPASDTILNAVLKVIQDHPEIKHLRVEGHTDNVGAAAMNKTLSGKRAASVVDWLVKHGVDKSRMSSQGFGMDKPIDTNDTPEGRQNNRRVEFHIEDEAGKE